MTIAEPGEPQLASPDDRAFIGHPKGLGYLSFTEACERFSYYSMQTLLVLYMVKYLLLPEHAASVIGLGWVKTHLYPGFEGQPLASAIFGTYTALVYGTPLIGGVIADKVLGRRNTLIAGGLLMALGHFLMAFEGSFLFALAALVVGVGFFKGNIASQVGALYSDTDLRRAMAFQIFYIFINVSVIAAPLISGTLGQNVGWHWGFGCAGVVMVLGLGIYLSGSRYLPPDNMRQANEPKVSLTRDDWRRIIVLLLLVPSLAVALLTNQEIFNAYLVWGDAQFDLNFMGHALPSSWLITLDATLSFSMLVAVAAFWNWRSRKGAWEPDEIGKMIIGSCFTMAGGMCLYIAAATQGSGKIGLFWPFMFHLVNSIGFAHILPISLALFTKLSPKSVTSTMLGFYYLSFFLANAIVGYVGGLYSSLPTTHFWLYHVAFAGSGLVTFVLFKLRITDPMKRRAAA
jgi:proton-dependent oligopeptide transporter, POT family